MSTILSPFQLLELNLISAQDLAPCSRKMQTYAVAWVHPDRKLSTRIDVHGHTNPTWNDKFVFRVDDEFLYGDTSAVMIEIYAINWFRDFHIGTVRVIIGNLIPPCRSKHQKYLQVGMRFVALQVRRPSGRPQGILNIGVALLDSSLRSMPLYTQLSPSAVDYRHFMGEEDPPNPNLKSDDKSSNNTNQFILPWIPKPELRRTKSESSSMIGSLKIAKASSMMSESDLDQLKKKRKNNNKGRSRASSLIYGLEIGKNGKRGKPTSVVSGSEMGALAKAKYDSNAFHLGASHVNKLKVGAPKKMTGTPIITESDLGPSPSEVAATMAKNNKHHHRIDEMESDLMAGWSLESSMEGLQSKLERWRAELPPIYDRGEFPGFSSTDFNEDQGGSGHNRRQTDDGGLFSCFSNICGLECSIVCGGPAGSSTRKNTARMKRSFSIDNSNFV